jgi:hypothetical protein
MCFIRQKDRTPGFVFFTGQPDLIPALFPGQTRQRTTAFTTGAIGV